MAGSALVLLGLWLGVIGYGVAYAGVATLRGQTCSIGDAFGNRCGTATSSPPVAATGGPGSGRTLRQHREALHAHQLQHLSRQPLLVRM